MTSTTVRWGILAPSGLAGRYVPDIKLVEGAEVVAVGSRDLARAQKFASDHDIAKAYGSYEELVDDPEVDVVHISSPHVAHYEHGKLALEHGKAVVLEKPFTINSAEAIDLVQTARSNKVFLMEGMWTRIHPNMIEMARLVRTGAIGHVRMIDASLGPIGLPRSHRALDPLLGGGALLECGVYPITLVHNVIPILGEPAQVEAWATFNEAGADDATSMIFRYQEGVIASLSTSLIDGLSSGLPSRAFISGTAGWIDIPSSIHDPNEFTIHRVDGDSETFVREPIGGGYTYEVAEVVRCLREGLTESPLVTLEDTLLVMRLLDRVRSKIRLVYPSER